MAEQDLTPLIRLRRWEIDEKRRKLADLFRQAEDLQSSIALLEAEQAAQALACDHLVAAGQVTATRTYGAFIEHCREKRARLDAETYRVEQLIRAAQDDLADSFQDLKTIEISQENREKRAATELDRKTGLELDEMGLDLHRRRDDTPAAELHREDGEG